MAIIVIVCNNTYIGTVGVAFHHNCIVMLTVYNPAIILTQHNYTGLANLTEIT